MHSVNRFRAGISAAVVSSLTLQPVLAQSTPTGAPLVVSTVETEQPIPLAILLPDGKTGKCVDVRLHWTPNPSIGPNDDPIGFALDLPPNNPAAPIFTAQLWNASLDSALAWQEPWQGARWKVLDTPVTDGSGLDAALAVGMIATSARRPYPAKTVIIGSLNPDGSLGPVSHLMERLNAAAQAGMERAIIPSVQRFDTDGSGQVVNVVRQADELHLTCVPVDDLVAATEAAMNDPLPQIDLDAAVPKYSNDVASYIDGFAQREQSEADSGLKFAPKEADLATYPPRLAATWKSVYADYESALEAYRGGQVYVAYRLFSRANGHMSGANALAGTNKITFDVKSALAEADDLHDQLHVLMNPPSIDDGSLQSSVLVAEMADWAFEVNAALEGAQLVTKQAFSQRSDATEAEKDRAREAIVFANGQCKYLITHAEFYVGLLDHLNKDGASSVDENAAHLLPQLIPAQLATARSFSDGIRNGDLRDALLFDPRMVAYVNVLRQEETDWNARLRKKEADDDAAAAATPASGPAASAPVKVSVNAQTAGVGFDPGNTYAPPHTVLTAPTTRKLSDVASCLIWANMDCEIAALDEKYLRLAGASDPTTHDWHVKDRARLDALVQMAQIGARRGIAMAGKAEIEPSVLAMIYERAAHQEIAGDDASELDSLRNYWRCALLGNMCWQLAHTHKAQAVDLSTLSPAEGGPKTPEKKNPKKTDDEAKADKPKKTESSKQEDEASTPPTASTNTTVIVSAPSATVSTNEVVTPIAAVPAPAAVAPADNPPVAPIATNEVSAPAEPPVAAVVTPIGDAANPPVAPIATNDVTNVTPPPPVAAPVMPAADTAALPPVAPIATNDVSTPTPPIAPAANPVVSPPVASIASAPPTTSPEDNIPVAPIARASDYASPAPATNAAPLIGPIPSVPKPAHADAGANGFP
jgi:hypothetical protein